MTNENTEIRRASSDATDSTAEAPGSQLALPSPRATPEHLSEERVITAYRAGTAMRDICGRFGLHSRDVYRIIDSAGVKRRKRGRGAYSSPPKKNVSKHKCLDHSTVIDSRPAENEFLGGATIRRRRECLKCKRRWTTLEIDASEVNVFYADTQRQLQQLFDAKIDEAGAQLLRNLLGLKAPQDIEVDEE